MSRLLTIRDPVVRAEIDGIWQEILKLRAQGSATAVSKTLSLLTQGQAAAGAISIRQPFDALALSVVGEAAAGTSPLIYLEPSASSGNIIDTSVTGCYLTAGGVWTSTSSSTKKIFLPLGWSEDDHLDKVSDLHVGPFEYKAADGSPGGERHYGTTAEQFLDLFGVGDGKGLAAMDLAAVGLIAVKSLINKVDVLEAEVKRLKALVEK